jgi:hypothetical protein
MIVPAPAMKIALQRRSMSQRIGRRNPACGFIVSAAAA